MTSPRWWQDAVGYQVYLRSFADSNGDGIGDLPGLIARLDYLEELGVTALWVSPFYPSPNLDWGYDVSDYCAVAPEYGSLDDVDRLIDGAHRRGIRVLLDLVLNHTSDQHSWFQASRSRRDSPYRDWYIWRDGRDGGPPNDWEALFGGSAWAYDEATGQYYYHFFFAGQPDLNWRNPAVRAAVADMMRFWLERGVDGFRLDAISHLIEREDLPDAGIAEQIETLFLNLRSNLIESDWPVINRKLRFQQHLDENHDPLRELRALVDGYGERVLLGETHEPVYYGDGRNELHSVFDFSLLHTQPLTARTLRAAFNRRRRRLPPGAWDCLTIGNHDRTRSYSFFADGVHDEARARLALGLVLLLPGTPMLYNGEEIGMRDLPPTTPEELQDGLAIWAYQALCRRPEVDPQLAFMIAARHIGRDANRTPMQWSDDPNAGFAPPGARPWLPLHPGYRAGVSVAAQRGRAGSFLEFTRALIGLRRAHPALRRGDLRFSDPHPDVLAFARRDEGETIVVMANLSAAPVTCRLPVAALQTRFTAALAGAAQPEAGSITLPPYALWVGARA